MSVLTVPRSIASSSLKNFSMNFTTMFLLQIGRVIRKQTYQVSSGNSYAPTKECLSCGGCLGSRKELLRLFFQSRTTFVRDEEGCVRVQRIQDDLIACWRWSSAGKIASPRSILTTRRPRAFKAR